MIEAITRENYPELQRRVQGSYGFLKKPSTGEKMVVQVNDVGARWTAVVDVHAQKYILNNDQGLELEFLQVPSQWFQPDPDHVIYVTRRPARQWKRGICDGNTHMYYPTKAASWDGKAMALVQCKVSLEHVAAIFAPEDNPDAFSDVEKQKNCGLWSKSFAWADDTVFCRNLMIGTINHDTKRIVITVKSLEQELRDALRRANSDYQIEQ